MPIWSYPEQGYNSATGRFVWLVRSPGTVYHCTFVLHHIINFQKHAQDTSVLTFLLHWLTVFRVRAANIARRPWCDTSHVTAPSKLSFYYYQSLLSTAVLHSASYYMQRHISRLVLEKVFTWRCCVYSELVLCEEVLYQSREQVAPVEDVVSLRNVFVIIFVVS